MISTWAGVRPLTYDMRLPAGRRSREIHDLQSDGLPDNRELLDKFEIDGQTLELQLERAELKPGFHVWLVSADSVSLIPKAHQLVAETPF